MELYTAMVKCRVAAEFGIANALPAANARTESEPRDEAILAGVVIDLQRGDMVLHPSLGSEPRRMKKSPLDQLFHALAKNGHPASADKTSRRSAGADKLKAVAKAARTSNEKKESIAVAFCDGVRATGGDWKKQLARASRKNWPVLFVCPEHALHASHRKKIAETEALLHGVPVIVVDGQDVVAVYRVASESIARARQRRGPTVIATTDFIPSSGAGKPAKSGAVVPSLSAMEKHLKEQGLYRPGRRAAIERAFGRNLKSAIRTRTR